MSMPRVRRFLAIALGAALLVVGGSGARTVDPNGAEGWQGLLGNRPAPQLGGRWVVVFKAQSLADRVAAPAVVRPRPR